MPCGYVRWGDGLAAFRAHPYASVADRGRQGGAADRAWAQRRTEGTGRGGLGAGTAVIGLSEGLAESAASLLKVISGWLSDRVGRRKWLTVAGYGLSTVLKPFLFWG